MQGQKLSTAALVPICQRRHSRSHLKEICHSTLIAEMQMVCYFTHRHVRLLQEIAYFLIEQGGDVIIHGSSRNILDHPGKIRCRDIQLVGIEPDLSLGLEMAIQEMKENLINFLLVAQIASHRYILVRKFRNQKIQDIHHRLDHLYLVDVLMTHYITNHMKDIDGRFLLVSR